MRESPPSYVPLSLSMFLFLFFPFPLSPPRSFPTAPHSHPPPCLPHEDGMEETMRGGGGGISVQFSQSAGHSLDSLARAVGRSVARSVASGDHIIPVHKKNLPTVHPSIQSQPYPSDFQDSLFLFSSSLLLFCFLFLKTPLFLDRWMDGGMGGFGRWTRCDRAF